MTIGQTVRTWLQSNNNEITSKMHRILLNTLSTLVLGVSELFSGVCLINVMRFSVLYQFQQLSWRRKSNYSTVLANLR